MKSERRHELQTNSLALWLRWRAPEIWEKHGTKILLGLIAVALAVMIIRWRLEAPKKAADAAERYLAEANRLMLAGPAADGGKVVESIQSALKASTDPDIQARAYLRLGDYYRTMANTPSPATTQPLFRWQTANDENMAKAKQAYEQALAANPTQPDLVAQAHLGLGVVYETQAFALDEKTKSAEPGKGELWTKAREQFAAVEKDPASPQAAKLIAQQQIRMLPDISKPVFAEQLDIEAMLRAATRPTTSPSTRTSATPSSFEPSSQPSTLTQPTTPATRPVPTVTPSEVRQPERPSTKPATMPN